MREAQLLTEGNYTFNTANVKIASFLPFPRAYETGRFTHRKYTQPHLEYVKLSGYEEIHEHYLSSKLKLTQLI